MNICKKRVYNLEEQITYSKILYEVVKVDYLCIKHVKENIL